MLVNSVSSELVTNVTTMRNTAHSPKAPLFSRLFMMPREMPSYLSMAYKLRFKNIKTEKGISGLLVKIRQYKQLIGEILGVRGDQSIFQRNVEKLESDFATLNNELTKTKRSICAYFVIAKDYNGAILDNPAYYYHHYKIEKYKKHLDVLAKVVQTREEMFKHLKEVKISYPDRPIEVVNLIGHGTPSDIDIDLTSGKDGETSIYDINNVDENEFNACSPNAAIIIDACATGAGNNSIAQKIAEKNPGKRVFAPGRFLFFSKPAFNVKNGIAKVAHVTHGFAIVNAYTSREFHVPLT